MIQYHFTCELLSEVIISSSSATEGFRPSLDYIPRSKFWGIVANEWYRQQSNQENLDLFHNGTVCFGDAHLEIKGQRSYKIPLSWFRNKHQPNAGIYVHHEADYEVLTMEGVQPEQLPADYFNEAGAYTKPAQEFSIKSAYDSTKRRSQDEQMFGYYALPASSRWQFTVSSEAKELLDKVKSALEGEKRIGRSRSAQYGLAEIIFEKENQQLEQKLEAKLHYLYADSPLMLPLEMTLADALPGIDFEKSKIRTRIYQSWNTERNTRDADRQIIEKGSVIVLKLEKETSIQDLLRHLRERSSEGFGHILINPPFLINVKDKHFAAISLSKWEKSESQQASIYINQGKEDEALISLLKQRKKAQTLVQDVGLAVNDFVENNAGKFRSVTASQWGTVRSMAKLFQGDELYRQLLAPGENGEKKGYLVSGIAEEKWRSGRSIIEDIVTGKGGYPKPRHLFLEKLAAEMAKRKHEKEN